MPCLAVLPTLSISGVSSSYTYTGSACKPDANISYGKTILKEGTDYTLSYKNNTNAGTATVTATGKGKYKGSISKTFKIAKRNVKTAKITGVSKRYKVTGKAIKPKVKTVKIGKVTLKKGRDYTVSYKNNKTAGTATATVKVLSELTGFKKGSSAAVNFTVAKKTVETIYPYREYSTELSGELFIAMDEVAAKGKVPKLTLYQASADGKKLTALNKKD